MEKLIEIYNELADAGVYLGSGSYHLKDECDSVLVCKDGRYGIFLDIDKIRTLVQEKEAVSHEWAHIETGSTYALNASPIVRAQAEHRADKAQIRKIVPKAELDAAVAAGRTELWELAELFDVTEPFMEKAISYYRDSAMAI